MSFFLNLKEFFENPPVLPLTLMRAFSKTHQSSLTLKGGSTSHLGLLPSGKKRKPLLLVARNHFILWLADHQRSRQQQSCVLRYATAWTRIADDCMLLARYLLLTACSLLCIQNSCSREAAARVALAALFLLFVLIQNSRNKSQIL